MKPKIQRHEHILTLVREHNFMTVEELAANLDVTPQTIRRDVQELSETGQLKRYHGGASLGDVSVVTAGQERRSHQQQEKNAIARLIASTIPDNASLFISIGTTMEAVAAELVRQRKTCGLSPTTSTLPPSLRRVPTTRSSSLPAWSAPWMAALRVWRPSISSINSKSTMPS